MRTKKTPINNRIAIITNLLKKQANITNWLKLTFALLKCPEITHTISKDIEFEEGEFCFEKNIIQSLTIFLQKLHDNKSVWT